MSPRTCGLGSDAPVSPLKVVRDRLDNFGAISAIDTQAVLLGISNFIVGASISLVPRPLCSSPETLKVTVGRGLVEQLWWSRTIALLDVLGGRVVLGPAAQGESGPRTSCPGGNLVLGPAVRGGIWS